MSRPYKYYPKKNYQPKKAFTKWLDDRLPIIRFLYEHIVSFPVPKNLNYFYTFGAVLLFMLISQIFSGIIMAMHYVPHIDMAFDSYEYTRRTVNYGWLFASQHTVGASFFFLAAYIHIARSIYYGSYKAPRELVWIIGLVIYFIMMAIAFTGYVLRWGMMSTTATSVISNFIGQIPFIGNYLRSLMLGSFCIGQPTLNHLYAFHIILPFILLFFVFLHIWAIHVSGQSNPLGIAIKSNKDLEPFAPNAIMKDIIAICSFAILFAIFVFYLPDLLQNNDNFMKGNPDMVTTHIAPEWYFLPFYSMLRCMDFNIWIINSAFAGFLVVSLAFLILFILPWVDKSPVNSGAFRPLYKIFFYLFIVDMIILGYLGNQPVSSLITNFSQICTLYYFVFFLIIIPFIWRIEPHIKLPESIASDVVEKRKNKERLRKNIW